jgi:lipid-A-disaccharide synthase-like uncharacterized protein
MINIINEWRVLLYYPLGVVPPIFFALRFLIQWIKSEKAGISYVDALFWRLSITGNLLSFLHYSIQGQYPFAIIQMGNALIAWRNLNLINIKATYTFSKTLIIFSLFLLSTTVGFVYLEWSTTQGWEWIRVPESSLFSISHSPGVSWHLFGLAGQGLFASRFWIQWWDAEKNRKTSLGNSFWYLSLSGSLLSAIYFLHIRDLVSFINQLFGIVPYLRNIMLSRLPQKIGS